MGQHLELAELLKNRRVDIACVQETKWKGSKSRDIGEGYFEDEGKLSNMARAQSKMELQSS